LPQTFKPLPLRPQSHDGLERLSKSGGVVMSAEHGRTSSRESLSLPAPPSMSQPAHARSAAHAQQMLRASDATNNSAIPVQAPRVQARSKLRHSSYSLYCPETLIAPATPGMRLARTCSVCTSHATRPQRARVKSLLPTSRVRAPNGA